MVDLIEFPTPIKDPHALPEKGDDYRAFAPVTAQPHFMLAFVFPDGSLTSYRFSDLQQMNFTPAKMTQTCDILNLRFSLTRATGLVDVRVEGRNFFDHCYHLGEQQIRWLRMLPPGWEVNDPRAAVITRIVMPEEI